MCVNKCTAVADSPRRLLSSLFLVPICGLPSPWRRSASETIHQRNKYWGAPRVYMCVQTFFKKECTIYPPSSPTKSTVWKKKNLFTSEHNKRRQQMSNVAWNLPKILSQVPPTRTFSTSICNVFNFIYIAPLSLSLSHTHTHPDLSGLHSLRKSIIWHKSPWNAYCCILAG